MVYSIYSWMCGHATADSHDALSTRGQGRGASTFASTETTQTASRLRGSVAILRGGEGVNTICEVVCHRLHLKADEDRQGAEKKLRREMREPSDVVDGHRHRYHRGKAQSRDERR